MHGNSIYVLKEIAISMQYLFLRLRSEDGINKRAPMIECSPNYGLTIMGPGKICPAPFPGC
jgi:hypothetical protein